LDYALKAIFLQNHPPPWMGTMDFGCFGESGCAFGSLLAAVMALSSSAVGMRIVGRLEIFDIVLDLAAVGTAQTDDSSRFAMVAIQDLTPLPRPDPIACADPIACGFIAQCRGNAGLSL
jgi:hypothetical protein